MVRALPHTPAPAAPLSLALADEGATARLGAALAPILAPGDWVTLAGPLGAGKTALARAILRARLDAPTLEVPSPSYTLVNAYAGAGSEVWHADLYRLSGAEEARELGLEGAGPAILLVEWPDRLGADLPPRRLEVSLARPESGGRVAQIRAHGPDWAALGSALEALA